MQDNIKCFELKVDKEISEKLVNANTELRKETDYITRAREERKKRVKQS